MVMRRHERRVGEDHHDAVIEPLPSFSRRPARDWVLLEVTADAVVLSLRGWRSLLAVRRRLSVPLSAITSVRHAPGVYGIVSTSLRIRVRPRSHVFRLGVFRGRNGWSFWACGIGRGAVLIETEGYRFRFVVFEVARPGAAVSSIEEALRALRSGRVTGDRDDGPAETGDRDDGPAEMGDAT